MWTRAAYIAKAVRMQVPDAHVRVTVGAATCPAVGFSKTIVELGQDLEAHYMTRDDFLRWAKTNNTNAGTILERFKPPFNADKVILIDADCFPVGDIMEPFTQPDLQLGGMIAHAAPFADPKQWDKLSAGFLHDRNKIINQAHFDYTGKGLMGQSEGKAPPYFNTGVVYASAAALTTLWPVLHDATEFMRGCMDSYFVDQLALTLALIKEDVLSDILDPRWNFPNDPAFDKAYPDQLADARWIHFLRDNQVQRERDFHDHDSIRNFTLRNDLKGSNDMLRKAVAKVYQQINHDI